MTDTSEPIAVFKHLHLKSGVIQINSFKCEIEHCTIEPGVIILNKDGDVLYSSETGFVGLAPKEL